MTACYGWKNRMLRMDAEQRAEDAEQKLASVLLAVEASGCTVDVGEDGTP